MHFLGERLPKANYKSPTVFLEEDEDELDD